MNQAKQLYRISELLPRFKGQVKILNSNGEFSINIHAENLLLKVLNEVYDCNLENVNYVESKNYPAIDLRDKAKRIAVQVTATATQDKVISTLEKFISNGLHKDFDKLYLFIIKDKQEKYSQSKIDSIVKGKFSFTTADIIDSDDIYKALNAQNDLQKIDKVAGMLEAQFADRDSPDKWDLFAKGMESYDEYIRHFYRFIDIKGFSPKINNTQVKVSLESIYVPLKLIIVKDDLAKEQDGKEYAVEEALEEFNKLVILGDPGSGKSTILKRLAYKICSNRENSKLVPVLIKGSEYAKFLATGAKGLAEFIIDQVDKKYAYLFTEKLESGELLVLIDGIDEINKIKLRHDVVNKINAFIAQHPNIKIIVSSRIVGYKEAQVNAHFHHLEVGKFESWQIQQFARNWYSSIAEHAEGDNDGAKKAEALYTAISQNKSVYGMATSPLLLTIIALIHYQGNTLPEKRAALYEVATSTFLENWVRQREVKKPSNFDKEMLIEMLSPISFHIHKNYTTGLISESELKILLLGEYKRINPRLTPKEEKSDVKDIIEFLWEDAGFLFEKGRNDLGEAMFGFVHQTFQEYFAAIEFVARWKEGAFKDNLDVFVFDASWREVITLAASIFRLNDNTRIGRQTGTRFIRDILCVKDPCAELSRPLIIAMAILANDAEVEFSLVQEVMDTAFGKVVTEEESLPEVDNYRSVWAFNPLLKGLNNMKQFHDYLTEMCIAAIKRKGAPPVIIKCAIDHLIEYSGIPTVKNELVKILRSKNNAVKWHLFNYEMTSPRAEIFKTDLFKEEILKFLNSDTFRVGYNGKLPEQYCFEINGDKWSLWPPKDLDLNIEQHILSINQLKCVRMQKDLIRNQIIYRDARDMEKSSRYLERVKTEFPEIDLADIERQISTRALLNQQGSFIFPTIRFESVNIHSQNKSAGKFAFVDASMKVEYLQYPFTKEDLIPYFKEEAAGMVKIFSALPAFNKRKGEVPISCMEDFLLFIKYYDSIGLYRVDLNIAQVVNFSLKYVLDDKNPDHPAILGWLKRPKMIIRRRLRIHKKFTGEKYKALVNSSGLASRDKLYILRFIGGKPDYEHLIAPTIDEFRSTTCVEEKKRIKSLLYDVLG